MRNRQSALSLVELLLAIFIISVLAVLGLREYWFFREKAKVAKCLSNIRGIGNGLQIYAAENNQMLPEMTDENVDIEGGAGKGGVDVRFILEPYDSTFWNIVCPADPRRKKDPTPENPTYLSYIYLFQSGLDIAKLDDSVPIVRDGSFYHGRPGNWTGTVLYSDNHCEAEKWKK